MANMEECKKILNDTIKEYGDRFVYTDTDSIIAGNEMIISIYDCFYTYKVKINGITQKNDYDIALEYHRVEPYGVIDFMKKHNVHRLIVCEDGDIVIYKR